MQSDSNFAPIYSGEFCHALDLKNRITVPSDWRTGAEATFFLVPDRTGVHLKALPREEFRKKAETAMATAGASEKEKAAFKRHYYSRARQVVQDKQGRLVLPEEFCQRLHLHGEIMFVGAGESFEMWSKEAWRATQDNDEAAFDRLSEAAGL